ncbi:MAG: GntR family transcriptional regulator [Rectinemataceae bacterium]
MAKVDASSLADKAYLALREMIVTLALKPGAIVSESDIARKLGIGRMPVRDAFRKLESEGLVTILPRKGVLISSINTEEIFLQLEVRTVLEELIVKRACKYGSDAQRSRLLELAEGYATATETGDRTLAVQVDEEFHTLMCECARNPFAWQAISPFYPRFQRIYYHQYRTSEAQVLKNNLAHMNLMRAIASGDEKTALASLHVLLDNLDDLVRGYMKVWLPDEK